MPDRHILGDNFEIQVRNCSSFILDAIEAHHPFERVTSLSKSDIVGLRLLEFRNFDSRIRNDGITPNFTYTYPLNRKYALTVSGEYSDNCFTVLLMITDRQANARFGLNIKVATDSSAPKTLHINGKISIFGVHCVITYNPDTNYYVFSIRPPLSNNDLDLEKTYAACTKFALICLEVDFVQGNISHEVYNYGREPVFHSKRATSYSFQSTLGSINKVYEHFEANMTLETNFEIVTDPTVASGIFKAYKFFNNTMDSSAANGTLTYKEVGGVEGLNFFCAVGKSLNGEESLSGGASYTIEWDDSFDLTVSGEYSNGCITVPVMITSKDSKYAFGFKFKLSGDPKESGLYVVVKLPFCETELVIKIAPIPKGSISVTSIPKSLISVFIRPEKDNYDTDKQNAAALGRDLICMKVDLSSQKITQEVYEYETIKEYGTHIYNADNKHLWFVLVPEYHQVKKFSILGTFKKLAGDVMDKTVRKFDFVETLKDVRIGIKKKLPYIVGGIVVAGGVFLLATLPPLTLPLYSFAFATTAPMMIAQRMQ